MAGAGAPDECSSPEVLPDRKGMSLSASYVHMISEASFRVPSGCTACPGLVVLEGDMAGGGVTLQDGRSCRTYLILVWAYKQRWELLAPFSEHQKGPKT